MNRERFNWGMILLFLGGILLLRNFGYIEFYWKSFFKMWPVLIILFGVNLLLPKKGIGPALSVILTLIALVFLGYQGMKHPRETFSWRYGNSEQKTIYRSESRSSQNTSTLYHVDLDSSMQVAQLHINGGATEYHLEATDGKYLVDARFEHSRNSVYRNSFSQMDSLVKVHLNMSNRNKGESITWDSDNEVHILLNKSLPWSIYLTSGAVTSDFDLRELSIQKLHFKGGASSFSAVMGMPLENTQIEVDSGVADVELEIPQAAACRIVVRTGMTSRQFKGFEKQEDGSYITPGYHEASNKFNITLRGGLSSFSVKRYE
jgi:hypothetical protein